MKERVVHMAGKGARGLRICTFHAFGADVLREDLHRLGWPKRFAIADMGDQLSLVKRAMRERRVDDRAFDARKVLGLISKAKNSGQPPQAKPEGMGTTTSSITAEVFPLYQLGLRAQGAVDFDDLVAAAIAAVPRAPRGARPLCAPAEVPAGRRVPGHQPRAAGAAHPPRRRRARNVCAVGDDDQVHLQLARRGGPQHPRLRARLQRRQGGAAGAELPLHPHHPGRGQRGHRPEPRPQGQADVDDRGDGGKGDRLRRADRARRGRVRRARDRPAGPQQRDPQLRRRDLLPDERPVAGVRRRVPARRAAVPGRRRGPVLRAPGRSATCWPTCGCCRTRTTSSACGASSTCPGAASASGRRNWSASTPIGERISSPPRCGSRPSSPSGWGRGHVLAAGASLAPPGADDGASSSDQGKGTAEWSEAVGRPQRVDTAELGGRATTRRTLSRRRTSPSWSPCRRQRVAATRRSRATPPSTRRWRSAGRRSSPRTTPRGALSRTPRRSSSGSRWWPAMPDSIPRRRRGHGHAA